MACAESWWEALRADPVPWLLNETPRNIMWRVLVELFERPADSLAVRRARSGANIHEPVASLLKPLLPDGSWVMNTDENAGLTPRDRVLMAVQAGADPGDPRLQAAAHRLLDLEFRGCNVCAVARDVQAFHALGWERDLRFEERVAWLAEDAPRAAGGGWACHDPAHAGPAGGCAVTAVSLLAAAGEGGGPRWKAFRSRSAGSLVRYLEASEAARTNGWHRPGHPNLERTDFVEALWSLARAGVPYDPRMKAALARLQDDQDGGGRWTLEAGPAAEGDGVCGETRGAPSRWITLRALVALKAYALPAELPRLFPEKSPVD
ncbi:MAG: hypothetical protein GXP48_03840 [Acidobacteria bacterium]|nr:hypothetical protein [Acidobacteriota bacterium]